ncbi:iron complex outermembrane receptor protein [Sphingomonas sp. SORGH_AS870]|uniref:TonB-dependent receptor domain-containing protein n=1 Tax=Sphingomonas sp. SORGH_AS_0870 TaxID=3041801 RepID=UPI002854694D|nr:TonB-dependent receptor [Sphingomonas sp. SORGH_AS_0870]MDR6144229.1 iron complex outermembrane receptor protein [Sphingomonas sp. SORGH_AS_0870]
MFYKGSARPGCRAGWSTIALAWGLATPLQAQTAPPPATTDIPPPEVTVTGKRIPGSVVGAVEPVAVLDAQALDALGVSSLSDLLKKVKALASSSGGGDPVMLLNGRRVSGFSEFQSLPYEAIEKVEVLPEQEAARFGYPPNVRVMNFITKKKFRAVTVHVLPGITTEGGGGTKYTEVTSARIDGPRRLTFNVSHLRQDPVLQSQRDIVPDPETLYATTGNVTGVDGASLDPRLDTLAGRAVTMAGVPVDPAARGSLAAYANSPAGVTDLGPYRTLQPLSDTIHSEASLAAPLGKTMSGSLILSMEAVQSKGLNGLAPALLRVPGGAGSFPFANDTLLYRYLPGSVLHQRTTSMALHGGGTLTGDVRRWSWAITGNYDRMVSRGTSETGVPLGALQASIDAGGDPMAAIDPALATERNLNRSRAVSDTLGVKATANGPVARLPAGEAMLTVTTDYARVDSDARTDLALPADGIGRTTRGASVNASVPLASAREGSLGFLGELQLSGMAGVSQVSGFGRLGTSNLGLNWTPFRPVQLNASVNVAQAAPAVTQLVAPVVATPNTPFFDFVTGRSTLVTTIMGGNPNLAPEKRRVTTLGLAVQPIKDKEIRLSLDYLDTRIDNQAASLGGATPAFQRVFPDLFARDALGALTRVDLRPVNLAFERERKLRLTFDVQTQLGKSPPPPAAPPAPDAAKTAPPPPPAQAARFPDGVGDDQLPAGGPADPARRRAGARPARRGDAERHGRAAALGCRAERPCLEGGRQSGRVRPHPGPDPHPQRHRRLGPAFLGADLAGPLQLHQGREDRRQALGQGVERQHGGRESAQRPDQRHRPRRPDPQPLPARLSRPDRPLDPDRGAEIVLRGHCGKGFR